MGEKIGVAVVGYGYWGPNLVRNFAANPDVELMGICDRLPDNLAKAGVMYPQIPLMSDYKALLGDTGVNAIVIAVPPKIHFPLAAAAINCGKHVFIEKPFTATVREGEELLDLAKKNGVMTFVDHPYVFSPAISKIKGYIDQGVLGPELFYYDSIRTNLGNIQGDVNVVADLAPHDLSILDYLLQGKAPASYHAFGSKHLGEQIEDAVIHLKYPGGFVANLRLSWLSPVKRREIALVGKDKMVCVDDVEPTEKVRLYDKSAQIDRDSITPFKPYYRSGDITTPFIEQTEPLKLVVESFVRSLRTGQTAINSGDAGLRVVRQIEQIQAVLGVQG